MKAKTIKAVLVKKTNELLKTVKDDEVRGLMNKDIIVTGGSIATMLLREKVSDFDIYFRTKETTFAVTKYYCEVFNRDNPTCQKAEPVLDDNRVSIHIPSAGATGEGGSQGLDYFQTAELEALEEATNGEDEELRNSRLDWKGSEAPIADKPKYRPIFISQNAITLSNRIQLVIRFWGEPDEIHKNYDFAHCTNWWARKDNILQLKPEAMEALLARELRYMGSLYPLCSLIRIRKFIARGWTINAGQILKMAMQLNDLDLKDVRVLEDQLTGVDTTYFWEIINRLKDVDPERVDSGYLMTIIDRVF